MASRDIDPKTRELLRLMQKHELTAREVGELVGRTRQAVKRWTGEFTIVSESMLALLKFRLKERTTSHN
jgi:hypothetical protein